MVVRVGSTDKIGLGSPGTPEAVKVSVGRVVPPTTKVWLFGVTVTCTLAGFTVRLPLLTVMGPR